MKSMKVDIVINNSLNTTKLRVMWSSPRWLGKTHRRRTFNCMYLQGNSENKEDIHLRIMLASSNSREESNSLAK